MIEIPIPERVSLNKFYAGMHWTKRKKLADTWHMWVRSHLIKAGVKPIKNYPISVHYTFSFKSRPQDWLNCGGMVKMIEDAMVGLILEDDGPKYIQSGTITVVVDKTKSDYVTIEIEKYAKLRTL